MKLLWASVLIIVEVVVAQYEVPDALVEVYHPRGLRVSIPDEEGIKLFAFHGRINQEITRQDGGEFSRDILKPKNGRWTFYDSQPKFKVGDVLNYWTYVDYFDGKNKLGYTKDDEFVVRELLNRTTSRPQPQPQPQPQPPPECSTIVNGQKKCSGEEIFTEDFSKLNSNVWAPEIKFATAPDYEFVTYLGLSQNLEVKDGLLKIRPVPTDEIFGDGFATTHREFNLGPNCTGAAGTDSCVQTPESGFILPPVTSALITTKSRFTFKYGKIEIRAKLPQGDWIYPELFLNPQSEHYGPGYASGQIRVAFAPGNEGSRLKLQGGCVLGDTVAARNYAMKSINNVESSWCEEFHNFTLVWKPNEIVVSVDGKVYGNVFAPAGGFASEAQNLGLKDVSRWRSGSAFAPFDQEMYLAIGVGVGGVTFEDREDDSKPWRNYERGMAQKFYKASSKWRPSWTSSSALEVDHIKIWAL